MPSISAILFALLPIDPQSMLRIIPSKFLKAPPNPAGPGFPLVAPSKLNLKEPSRGLVNVFAMLTEVSVVLVHVLLTGNSTIPISYRIFLLFTSAGEILLCPLVQGNYFFYMYFYNGPDFPFFLGFVFKDLVVTGFP